MPQSCRSGNPVEALMAHTVARACAVFLHSSIESVAVSLKRICVFCGSSVGTDTVYRAATVALARELASRGIGLVYGGASVGLMGVLADSVLAEGGEVIGVLPRAMADREIAHPGLTRLHVVESMHERKALMAELSDAFVALPGGFGTFEEFCEAVTWTQLGLHRKRCGLLNVAGFYDSLLALFDRAVADGFLKPQNRTIVAADADPAALLDRLVLPAALPEAKWIPSLDQT